MAQFYGGAGADTYNGTSGEDHIHGFGGADRLSGGAGDDWRPREPRSSTPTS